MNLFRLNDKFQKMSFSKSLNLFVSKMIIFVCYDSKLVYFCFFSFKMGRKEKMKAVRRNLHEICDQDSANNNVIPPVHSTIRKLEQELMKMSKYIEDLEKRSLSQCMEINELLSEKKDIQEELIESQDSRLKQLQVNLSQSELIEKEARKSSKLEKMARENVLCLKDADERIKYVTCINFQ